MTPRKGHHGAYGRFVQRRSRRWKRGVPCRCSRCGRRRTLSQPPEHYVQRVRATCCGRLLRIDWYRYTGGEGAAQRCTCQGYMGQRGECFPHRRGSLFCQRGGAAWAAGFDWSCRNTDEFLEWLSAHPELPPHTV